MPDGNTTLILVVRNPVEVVLSALFYHRPVRALHGGKLQYAICVWPQSCLCHICVCRHPGFTNASSPCQRACRQQPAPEQWIDAVSANVLGGAWVRSSTSACPAACKSSVVWLAAAAARHGSYTPCPHNALHSLGMCSSKRAPRLLLSEPWAGYQAAALLALHGSSRMAGERVASAAPAASGVFGFNLAGGISTRESHWLCRVSIHLAPNLPAATALLLPALIIGPPPASGAFSFAHPATQLPAAAALGAGGPPGVLALLPQPSRHCPHVCQPAQPAGAGHQGADAAV